MHWGYSKIILGNVAKMACAIKRLLIAGAFLDVVGPHILRRRINFFAHECE